jgi:hypothetical protein
MVHGPEPEPFPSERVVRVLATLNLTGTPSRHYPASFSYRNGLDQGLDFGNLEWFCGVAASASQPLKSTSGFASGLHFLVLISSNCIGAPCNTGNASDKMRIKRTTHDQSANMAFTAVAPKADALERPHWTDG